MDIKHICVCVFFGFSAKNAKFWGCQNWWNVDGFTCSLVSKSLKTSWFEFFHLCPNFMLVNHSQNYLLSYSKNKLKTHAIWPDTFDDKAESLLGSNDIRHPTGGWEGLLLFARSLPVEPGKYPRNGNPSIWRMAKENRKRAKRYFLPGL